MRWRGPLGHDGRSSKLPWSAYQTLPNVDRLASTPLAAHRGGDAAMGQFLGRSIG